jgi:hypothetical protein
MLWPTHALLQRLPIEASKDSRYGEVDVLAIGSRDELEQFLTDYQRRHDDACREWKEWDDHSKEWDASFDSKHDELCAKHAA